MNDPYYDDSYDDEGYDDQSEPDFEAMLEAQRDRHEYEIAAIEWGGLDI